MKIVKTKPAPAKGSAAARKKAAYDRAQLAAVHRLMDKAMKVLAPPKEWKP